MNNEQLGKEVRRLVQVLLTEKGYVCMVDILLKLGYLTKQRYEDWRFGKVDFLERSCTVNLSKLTLVHKLMVANASTLGLKKSWTSYKRFGKGPKSALRFSKSGKPTIEEAYATHYVATDRIKGLAEIKHTKDLESGEDTA